MPGQRLKQLKNYWEPTRFEVVWAVSVLMRQSSGRLAGYHRPFCGATSKSDTQPLSKDATLGRKLSD